jgi:hypothetical protein
MRIVISIATAPHPYYQQSRRYEHAVTPAGWFEFGADGMPQIWFQDYSTGERVPVTQHVGEREVDGAWFFDDEWTTQCWLGTANLKHDVAYTLNIEGSERSYQAVPPGPCTPIHHMLQQQPGSAPRTTNSARHTDSNSTTYPINSASTSNNDPTAGATSPLVWMAPVQKVVFAKSHMAYIVRQHLEHHMRLGMAGMLLPCDYFVCLELLQDPALARRTQEGRLVLWVWVSVGAYSASYDACDITVLV